MGLAVRGEEEYPESKHAMNEGEAGDHELEDVHGFELVEFIPPFGGDSLFFRNFRELAPIDHSTGHGLGRGPDCG